MRNPIKQIEEANKEILEYEPQADDPWHDSVEAFLKLRESLCSPDPDFESKVSGAKFGRINESSV